ncbi:O-methyltransferase [candidate division KSB1 bacterium]|nr:O-methyltransferase [candidate division KSB1 bacterium]
MNPEQWTAVDAYVIDLLHPADAVLADVLRACDDAGLPRIQVAPNQGKLLQILGQVIGARQILEIGTLGGYSTIWLARGLPADGYLLTLEANSHHADVARANLRRAGYERTVEVRQGNALEILPELVAARRGPFDLIFIDADKPSYAEYFAWSLKLARPGTLIIADNVIRHGEVANGASADPLVVGVRQFLAAVAAEPRVQATAIQTVGCKGWDGLAVMAVMGK